MSVLDAAIQVLKEAGKPLHAKEIAERIMEAGLWSSDGKTKATELILRSAFLADRVISQDIVASMSLTAVQKNELLKVLKQNGATAKAVMGKYPSYFQERLNELLQ